MTDTSINDFNLKIRQSPWYQEWFAARGLDPNKVKLDDKQRQELKGLVETQTGFKMPGDMKIDPAGNLNEKGGWAGLPTGVKIALIAAAAVGTAGAAGAFSGGAAAAGAGGGAGSTAAGSAALPTLASTAYGSAAAAAPTLTGASTIGGIVGAGGAGMSTMDRIGGLLKAGAGPGAAMVGQATRSAAEGRAQDADLKLRANAQDITGESNFQNQQLSQAKEEAAQRDEARKALYRANVMRNPMASPGSAAPTFSPEMMEGLTNLEKQALARTGDEPIYTSAKMRKPRDYQPLDVESMSRPSTMERVGNWITPGLSIYDQFEDIF